MNKPRSLEEVFTMLQQVNSRLEKLEKLDVDLHGRKIINASNAVNLQDYVTLNDLENLINKEITSITTEGVDTDSAVAGSSVLHKLKHLFANDTRFQNPSGTTIVQLGQAGQVKRLRIIYTESTTTTTINSFDTSVYTTLNLDGHPLNLGVNAVGTINIGAGASLIGFFSGTAAAQQTLSAYTTNSQSGAYTGINNAQAGTVYATVADLNFLRVAYENLRAMCDDLRTKIKNTTLVL